MNQQYFEKSERYLLDQMSAKEKETFEQEVKTNKELNKEFELAKSIMGSAAVSAKNKIKVELNEIHAKHFREGIPTKAINTKKWKIWPIVSGIAAIFILILLAKVVMAPKTFSPRELYATHYSAPELELTYRGNDESQILGNLAQAYNDKNYETFLSKARTQDSLISAMPMLQLAKAIAYLEMGNSDSARILLEVLVNNPFYKEQAKWYLALAYLHDNNIQKARLELEEISREKGKYEDKATSILQVLQN